MTTDQTTSPRLERLSLDQLLDLVVLRVADLLSDKVEDRLATIETDVAFLCREIGGLVDDAAERHADLRDLAISAAIRPERASPVEVLGAKAARLRYVELRPHGLSDADLLRDTCGAVYWDVQRGTLDRELVLRVLAEACEDRLSVDEVAAIVVPALAAPAKGRR